MLHYFLASTLFASSACGDLFGGGGDDDEESGDGTTGIEAPGSLSINSLAGSYPEGLSISSFPDEVDSEPGVAASGTLAIEETTVSLQGETLDAPKHPKELLKDAKDRLDGNADSCFDPGALQKLTHNPNIAEYCFGFDYGIISGTTIGVGDGGQVNNVLNNNADASEATLKTKFEEIASTPANPTEACMISVSKVLVTKATDKISSALNLFKECFARLKNQILQASSLALEKKLT